MAPTQADHDGGRTTCSMGRTCNNSWLVFSIDRFNVQRGYGPELGPKLPSATLSQTHLRNSARHSLVQSREVRRYRPLHQKNQPNHRSSSSQRNYKRVSDMELIDTTATGQSPWGINIELNDNGPPDRSRSTVNLIFTGSHLHPCVCGPPPPSGCHSCQRTRVLLPVCAARVLSRQQHTSVHAPSTSHVPIYPVP